MLNHLYSYIWTDTYVRFIFLFDSVGLWIYLRCTAVELNVQDHYLSLRQLLCRFTGSLSQFTWIAVLLYWNTVSVYRKFDSVYRIRLYIYIYIKSRKQNYTVRVNMSKYFLLSMSVQTVITKAQANTSLLVQWNYCCSLTML